MMEMSDDSITSVDPQQLGMAGPHDWSSGNILSSTAANVSQPSGINNDSRMQSNGAFSGKENGEFHQHVPSNHSFTDCDNCMIII